MSILDGYEAHIVRHVPEIRYVVNTARDLILEEWSGDITRDILAEHWKKFVADTRVMACRRSLADISGANIRLNGAELGELVAVLVEPALAGRKWITAIIVATDLQYGTAGSTAPSPKCTATRVFLGTPPTPSLGSKHNGTTRRPQHCVEGETVTA